MSELSEAKKTARINLTQSYNYLKNDMEDVTTDINRMEKNLAEHTARLDYLTNNTSDLRQYFVKCYEQSERDIRVVDTKAKVAEVIAAIAVVVSIVIAFIK